MISFASRMETGSFNNGLNHRFPEARANSPFPDLFIPQKNGVSFEANVSVRQVSEGTKITERRAMLEGKSSFPPHFILSPVLIPCTPP